MFLNDPLYAIAVMQRKRYLLSREVECETERGNSLMKSIFKALEQRREFLMKIAASAFEFNAEKSFLLPFQHCNITEHDRFTSLLHRASM